MLSPAGTRTPVTTKGVLQNSWCTIYRHTLYVFTVSNRKDSVRMILNLQRSVYEKEIRRFREYSAAPVSFRDKNERKRTITGRFDGFKLFLKTTPTIYA